VIIFSAVRDKAALGDPHIASSNDTHVYAPHYSIVFASLYKSTLEKAGHYFPARCNLCTRVQQYSNTFDVQLRSKIPFLHGTSANSSAEFDAMDSSSAPLADYFWIAGIDSLSYSDPVSGSSNSREKPLNGGPPSPVVDATIEEGSEIESTASPPSNGTPRATARHSRTNSWNRLSKLPNDVRNSIAALDELEKTRSNRSSITIKGVPTNGATTNGGEKWGLGDFNFDEALIKFANERESFLDDLSFSAGAPVQKPPPMTHPRTDRLKIEDNENSGTSPGRRSPLREVGGSIRRRISFRDMSSVKRQSTMAHRTCKWPLNRRNKFCPATGSL
jgi:hypothetical protein